MNYPSSKIVRSQSSYFMHVLVIFIFIPLYSCDDSSSGPSTETLTVLGNLPTSCTSHIHSFQAGEGPVTVTLIESTGNTDLFIQVCAEGINNNNCTINQTAIAVGQNVSGNRIGITTQVLEFQTQNCSGGGPDPTTPINYTATVVFSRP